MGTNFTNRLPLALYQKCQSEITWWWHYHWKKATCGEFCIYHNWRRRLSLWSSRKSLHWDFKEPESYESMKMCLQDNIRDVKRLARIDINGETNEIQYFLGGDWKFPRYGHGNRFCIFQLRVVQVSSPWAFWFRSAMVNQWCELWRKNEHIHCRLKKEEVQCFKPLFPTIPLTRLVVDNLHMFLHVAGTLIDLLVLEIRRLDCIEKATKLKSIDWLYNIRKYENAVTSLGITGFNFWIGRESKKLKCRTLTGPGKLLVLDLCTL